MNTTQKFSSLTVSTAPMRLETRKGPWTFCDVHDRIEFVIDGVPVTQLIMNADIHVDGSEASPFELIETDAQAVMNGDAEYPWGHIPLGRVPLLLCWCGDAFDWVVTARLSRKGESASLSDWHFGVEGTPEDFAEAMRSVPAFAFHRQRYAEAMAEAQRLADRSREPVTRVRVRRPGPWWRNILATPEERSDSRAMLQWLDVQAVTPSIHQATGGYMKFLVALRSAHHLLAASSHIPSLTSADRDIAVSALREVLMSPHTISLPAITRETATWFLELLTGSAT